MDISKIPTSGLMFSWLISPDGNGTEIKAGEIHSLVLQESESIWLHLNYANTQVQSWLKSSHQLPDDIVEILQEDVARVRQKTFTKEGSAHLIFFSDFIKEFNEQYADEIVTLWVIRVGNVLITLRPHPVESIDKLRSMLSIGRFKPKNIGDIYSYMLDLREDMLHAQANILMDRMDQLEEVIIRGETLPEHETLGRIRIKCNRMRRYFSPELTALNHLIRNKPDWMTDENHHEVLEFSEKLSVLVQELDHLYERAKVLQDEQSAHIAQFNANNLQVLSIMTVIFLPMTLLSGIMGMNMEDLPGLKGSFHEVMFLMIVAGISMFAYLRIKKII